MDFSKLRQKFYENVPERKKAPAKFINLHQEISTGAGCFGGLAGTRAEGFFRYLKGHFRGRTGLSGRIKGVGGSGIMGEE
jgi:hypothetical protein